MMYSSMRVKHRWMASRSPVVDGVRRRLKRLECGLQQRISTRRPHHTLETALVMAVTAVVVHPDRPVIPDRHHSRLQPLHPPHPLSLQPPTQTLQQPTTAEWLQPITAGTDLLHRPTATLVVVESLLLRRTFRVVLPRPAGHNLLLH